jgi:hypothetical protein
MTNQQQIKLSDVFARIHDQLTMVREILEECGDETALQLLEQMESGTLLPMRRIRLHLDVPYDHMT